MVFTIIVCSAAACFHSVHWRAFVHCKWSLGVCFVVRQLLFGQACQDIWFGTFCLAVKTYTFSSLFVLDWNVGATPWYSCSLNVSFSWDCFQFTVHKVIGWEAESSWLQCWRGFWTWLTLTTSPGISMTASRDQLEFETEQGYSDLSR